VRQASGIPCALLIQEGTRFSSTTRAHSRREINFSRHCEERSDDASAEARRAEAEAIQTVSA
jgi:hypothetical protein